MATCSTVKSILESKPHSQVWMLEPQESVYRAVELMSEKNIGAVLVHQDEKILGILTERDYARKIVLKQRSSRETTVAEIMSSPVLYVTPEETAEACMALMTQRRLRHLPVLQKGMLVGIISIGDIVNTMVADREFLIDQLLHYITGSHRVASDEMFAAAPAPVKVLTDGELKTQQ